jgi:tRNA-2-methylthio-N6-dimethylallyladenosine synthase
MTNKFYSVKPILDKKLKQVYIETYGCQMNVNDSEVVLSVLQQSGYSLCDKLTDASLILINTCSIRDNAEQKIWSRLEHLRALKRKKRSLSVGILGCMAERLEEKLLEHGVADIVAGPDSYRDLPRLLEGLATGEKQINTILSMEETYDDISPVRMDKNGVSAYISIMRGCNNFCSYCVVPYVRGRERSRDPRTILNEAGDLFKNGYKEVTLLGQNVNSYKWADISFSKLLEMVAQISPQLRVRFSTSHPKDMDDSVLTTMVKYPNICRHIHLPVQSGSNAILKRMNRGYTREEYLSRLDKIRKMLPECTISTDIIAGFCGETLQDHLDTLSIMREAGYYTSFMFQYSQRPNTTAADQLEDDVPPQVKSSRLNEIIELQNGLSHISNKADLGKEVEVLVEGVSKRSKAELSGRTSQNKICIFPAGEHKVGDYVKVRVTSCTSATLKGQVIV